MKHYLTEKQVLKKIGIPDFRHLSKENIIKFASMIPDMQIEVAQKALDQFPQFASTSLEVMNDYKSIIENVVKSDDESTKRCYEIYNRVLDALKEMLDNGEDLSFEEKMVIMNQMKDVADMASAKDTEHKRFLAGLATVAGAVALGITAMLASTLGTKVEIPCKEESEINDEDNDKEE